MIYLADMPEAPLHTPEPRYMARCLQLAALGAGHTVPNPMVGAVLVHAGRVIGEGYHEAYGGPHAEVNCIEAVKPADKPLIPLSVLYVSLEPCAHYGKTPPCADRIIREGIPEVVVGCRDPFPLVDGKGLEKLKAAGVRVHFPFQEKECREANRRFFTFHERHRPYLILKWAETSDQYISGPAGKQLAISGDVTNRLVHRWRGQEAAILVGTNTALGDNPRLTARFGTSKNPVRLVLDRHRRLPPTLFVFDDEAKTILLTEGPSTPDGRETALPDGGLSLPERIAAATYALGLQSVLVEGGRQLLQAFIDAGCWDEIRRISSRERHAGDGIPAPRIGPACLSETVSLPEDELRFYRPLPGFSENIP